MVVSLVQKNTYTNVRHNYSTIADLQLNEWRQEKETMQRERETNDDQLHLCISLLITNCRRLLYHFLHLNSCIYPLPNEYTPFNCHYRLRQTVNKVINIIGKLLSDLLILCTASPPVDRSIDRLNVWRYRVKLKITIVSLPCNYYDIPYRRYWSHHPSPSIGHSLIWEAATTTIKLVDRSELQIDCNCSRFLCFIDCMCCTFTSIWTALIYYLIQQRRWSLGFDFNCWKNQNLGGYHIVLY